MRRGEGVVHMLQERRGLIASCRLEMHKGGEKGKKTTCSWRRRGAPKKGEKKKKRTESLSIGNWEELSAGTLFQEKGWLPDWGERSARERNNHGGRGAHQKEELNAKQLRKRSILGERNSGKEGSL